MIAKRLGRLRNFLPGGGGYEAGGTSTRRKSASTVLGTEDHAQTRTQRKQLTANGRDMRRNFAPAAWAIRKHLDYVSTFTFQAKTGDDALNQKIEAFVKYASKAENFDSSGRHDRDAFVRLLEASRTVDGDVWPMKRADGTLQAIESDRVAIPTSAKLPGRETADDYTHGVRTDLRGRIRSVAVCDREGGNLKFRAVFPGRFFWHLGYFDRFDQVRGVSPLASALKQFRDVHENFDLALAKAKVEQLFALVFTRGGEDELVEYTATTDSDGDGTADGGYSVDFGKGPVQLDLDPGDDAKFLKSEAPGGQFLDFTRSVIMVALKSLDIPYSFYSEDFTNFYGSRGAVIQYVESCRPKRRALAEFLDSWLRWRLAVGVRNGEIDLTGVEIDELKWNWNSPAVPFWDPVKEARGLGLQVAAGITNLEQVATVYGGGDVYDNIEANKRVLDYAAERGVPIVLPEASAYAEITAPNQEANDG